MTPEKKSHDRLDRLMGRHFARAGQSGPGEPSPEFEQRILRELRAREGDVEARYFLRNVCRPMVLASSLAALALGALALGTSHGVDPYTYLDTGTAYLFSAFQWGIGG